MEYGLRRPYGYIEDGGAGCGKRHCGHQFKNRYIRFFGDYLLLAYQFYEICEGLKPGRSFSVLESGVEFPVREFGDKAEDKKEKEPRKN